MARPNFIRAELPNGRTCTPETWDEETKGFTPSQLQEIVVEMEENGEIIRIRPYRFVDVSPSIDVEDGVVTI